MKTHSESDNIVFLRLMSSHVLKLKEKGLDIFSVFPTKDLLEQLGNDTSFSDSGFCNQNSYIFFNLTACFFAIIMQWSFLCLFVQFSASLSLS